MEEVHARWRNTEGSDEERNTTDEFFSHPSSFVRWAAVSACSYYPYDNCIPQIIQLVDDRGVLLRGNTYTVGQAASYSLFRLTGVGLDFDQMAWQEWWRGNQRSFAPRPVDERPFKLP